MVEDAIKFAQIVSDYENFPQFVNIWIESDTFKPNLRDMFKSHKDIVDFARFIMHNLLHVLTKE